MRFLEAPYDRQGTLSSRERRNNTWSYWNFEPKAKVWSLTFKLMRPAKTNPVAVGKGSSTLYTAGPQWVKTRLRLGRRRVKKTLAGQSKWYMTSIPLLEDPEHPDKINQGQAVADPVRKPRHLGQCSRTASTVTPWWGKSSPILGRQTRQIG